MHSKIKFTVKISRKIAFFCVEVLFLIVSSRFAKVMLNSWQILRAITYQNGLKFYVGSKNRHLVRKNIFDAV